MDVKDQKLEGKDQKLEGKRNFFCKSGADVPEIRRAKLAAIFNEEAKKHFGHLTVQKTALYVRIVLRTKTSESAQSVGLNEDKKAQPAQNIGLDEDEQAYDEHVLYFPLAAALPKFLHNQLMRGLQVNEITFFNAKKHKLDDESDTDALELARMKRQRTETKGRCYKVPDIIINTMDSDAKWAAEFVLTWTSADFKQRREMEEWLGTVDGMTFAPEVFMEADMWGIDSLAQIITTLFLNKNDPNYMEPFLIQSCAMPVFPWEQLGLNGIKKFEWMAEGRLSCRWERIMCLKGARSLVEHVIAHRKLSIFSFLATSLLECRLSITAQDARDLARMVFSLQMTRGKIQDLSDRESHAGTILSSLLRVGELDAENKSIHDPLVHSNFIRFLKLAQRLNSPESKIEVCLRVQLNDDNWKIMPDEKGVEFLTGLFNHPYLHGNVMIELYGTGEHMLEHIDDAIDDKGVIAPTLCKRHYRARLGVSSNAEYLAVSNNPERAEAFLKDAMLKQLEIGLVCHVSCKEDRCPKCLQK